MTETLRQRLRGITHVVLDMDGTIYQMTPRLHGCSPHDR
jgi:hypothetical protein